MTSQRRSRPKPPAGSTSAERRANPVEADGWVAPVPGGCLLRVHVQPGASRGGVEGVHDGALRVRVRARPVDGAANHELLQVLANALGVRPTALSIESGGQTRRKRLRVAGIAADSARARLRALGSIDKGGACD